MPLRVRILLWVSSLFIITIVSIFVIGSFEINSSLKKEETALIQKVNAVGKENFENIEKYLEIEFNNAVQKMDSVFESMTTSSQWRLRFLPDAYNVETRNWGSSAAVLATYPWLDLINIEINGKENAYIYEAAPFLQKFIKIPISEDLALFSRQNQDGAVCVFVGIPFWSNKIIKKYVDDSAFPDFFLAKNIDQWLLYDVAELLALDPGKLQPKNTKLYKHLFDEAITIHSQQEFDFLFNSLKVMLEVTKKNLLAHPSLIKTLSNKESTEEFIHQKINEIKPDLNYQRNSCSEPLCTPDKLYSDPNWSTRRDFQHKILQKHLIWELCMLTRTGVWDYSPFTPGAPKGIVSNLSNTKDSNPAFFENVVEGFFVSDVFLNKRINIAKTCTLEVGNKEYDRKIIFNGESSGVAKSCRNTQLEILYDKDLREPFITSTYYITYFKPPMEKPNIAAITLGISLDPTLLLLALVSPDDIAFIFGDQNIRLYTTKGQVSNILNDPKDPNRIRLLANKEGFLVDETGEELYFSYITKITEKDGSIVLIEKQESRITIINAINNHIKKLSHRVIINSSILIIISLIIIMIILSRVIGAITKPINDLAEVVTHVTDRSLESIHFDTELTKRNDEVGTLYQSFSEMIKSMQEGHKVRGLLDKVVSKQVAEKIVKEGIKLGGEKKIISVMFCDIRNFTSISEKMDPEDLLVMLNQCLTLLSGVIDDFEGVIDKYEGDKIMTLFGAPLDTPDHSLKAVLCAIEMQKALERWNSVRQSSNLCKLEVGIGIHSGEAVAGNVGAENHLSYTVLGHIVNLSARLCDYAKACEILITKQTLDNLSGQVEAIENEAHKFKGITEPVVTYSVIYKK